MLGNPEWKARDENSGELLAPLVQHSTIQWENGGQVAKPFENLVGSLLNGTGFKCAGTQGLS